MRTLVWLGRTTPEWRWSSVAIVVRPSRSATVITAGVDAAEVLVGVLLGQLGDARPVGSGEGSTTSSPSATDRYSAASAAGPSWRSSSEPVSASIGSVVISGPGCDSSRSRQVSCAGSLRSARRAARRCRPAGSATEPFGEHLLDFRQGAAGGGLADRDGPEAPPGRDVLGRHARCELIRGKRLARGLPRRGARRPRRAASR